MTEPTVLANDVQLVVHVMGLLAHRIHMWAKDKQFYDPCLTCGGKDSIRIEKGLPVFCPGCNGSGSKIDMERLERMLGRISDWSALTRLIPFEWSAGTRRRSALASTLLACLEMARDGRVEIRQLAPFDEIFIKDRVPAPEATA